MSSTEARIAAYRQRALDCVAEGNVQGEAHAIRHWADLLRRAGETAAARDLYEDALAKYREARDTHPMNLANALRGFALLDPAPAPGSPALAAWREARDIYAAHGVDAGVSECDQWLGAHS